MAERILSRDIRTIPNWQMDKPWSAPLEPGEEEAIATSGLLAGANDTNRQVTQVLQAFSGLYVQALQRARG